MTTMTDDPSEPNALLAAQVHRLSDPLGAMGHRSVRERVNAERRARSILAAAILSTLLVLTGLLAAGDERPATPTAGQDVPTSLVSGDLPHVRTRSS